MHDQASAAGERGPGAAEQENTGQVGHADQLRAIPRTAAAQHGDQVPVYGMPADALPYRDLAVRQPLRHLTQNARFARGQVLGCATARCPRQFRSCRWHVSPAEIIHLIYGHHESILSAGQNIRKPGKIRI